MDFFSKIFKNKKIVFSLLLLTIIFYVSAPVVASAYVSDYIAPSTVCGHSWFPNEGVSSYNPAAYAVGAMNATVAGVVDIIEWIPKQLSYLVATFAGWVMKTVLNWPTTNPGSSTDSVGKGASLAFFTGWTSDRDLANMLIVLGFIVVAIAFALRLGEYGSQKTLVNLIIVALLVNFSGLFCGLIIDASTLTMHGFLQGPSDPTGNPTTVNMATDFYNNINKAEGNVTCAYVGYPADGKNGTASLINYIASDILFAWLYVALTSCFIFLAFMMVVRYAALGILFMLSPLAFFCWVFPATKSIWNKWLNSFLKWAFIGVYMCYFLWIVSQMISGMAVLNSSSTSTDLLTIIAYFLVCMITLQVGYYISLKAAAATAPAVVAAVKTAIGFATGAVVGFATGGYAGMAAGAMSGAKKGGMGGGVSGGVMAGGAAGASGGTGLAGSATMGRLAGAKDAITQRLENWNVIKPGTTALSKRSRLDNKLNEKDRTERIDKMTDDQKVKELELNRGGESASIDRAAITKDLISKGKGGLINETIKERSINEAIRNGVKAKDIIGGMESKDIAKLLSRPENDIKNDKIFTPEAMAEGFKTLNKRKDLDLINSIYRPAALENAVKNGARIEEIESSDYHYAAQNKNRLDRVSRATLGKSWDLASPDEQKTVRENAMEQALDEQFANMSGEQLRNVDAKDLTAIRVNKLTPDKIGAFKYAKNESKQAIKDLLDETIDPSTKMARGALMREADKAWDEYQAAINPQPDPKTGITPPQDPAMAANRLTEVKRMQVLNKVMHTL